MSRTSLTIGLFGLLLLGCGISKSRYIPYAASTDDTSDGAEGAEGTTEDDATDTEAPTAALVCDAATAFTDNLTAAFTVTGCNCHAATPPIPTGNAATDGKVFFDAATDRGSAQALVDYLTGADHTGAAQVNNFITSFNQWVTDCDGP